MMTAATAPTTPTPAGGGPESADSDGLGVGHPLLRWSTWPRWRLSS